MSVQQKPSSAAILATLAALAACGGGSSPSPAPAVEALRWPSPSYAQVQSVFSTSCTSCHGSQAGLSLAAPGSWANLVGVPAQASAGTRVVPNDSAGSVLHRRITGTGLPIMPPGGALAEGAVEVVRAWIDEGGARQDLSVSLTGMDPHVGERVVLRLEGDSGELRTKVVLDPLPAAAFDVFVPRARPGGSHALAVWADHDGDGRYDAPPTDHAWSRSVPATGAVSLAHDTSFTDVGAAAASEPGLDFTLELSDMTPHLGQALTVAVFERKTAPLDDQLVGLYRKDAVPSAAFSIVIPGVVRAFEDYWIDIHADHDGDGAYDAPPADHAWRVFQSSDATGLSVPFTHGTTFTDVSRSPAR